MSYSKNKKSNSVSRYSQTKLKENKIKKIYTHKKYSPNNNYIGNMKLIQNDDSNSSGITNISIFKEKEKILNFPYFSFPIKSLDEYKIENYFLPKNKKIFESQKVVNNKKISFQRKKDKKILEFSLFDDKIIFKDINKAYLQDELSDDGDESSDEKIRIGKKILIQELEESAKDLQENLRLNKGKLLLSRRIRFKIEDNKK